ncbi:MAG: hypothetical protein K2J79_04165 [Ruminiclostridium sp.]|nr:hypothetical protein [Ruminiclostridium sp.]
MKRIKTAAAVFAALTTASLLTVSAFALEVTVRDGQTSESCFTYEQNNTAWAHLINPYNQASLYNVPSAKEYADDTKDLIVRFTVSGVQEEFSVYPGFQCYGDDKDDGEELSIWSQSDYTSASGSEYTYKIDRDGSYELVVPLKALADEAVDIWGENLENVGILELCFVGVGNDDLTGFKYEGFSVEFIGIVESNISRSVEECAFNGGEPVKFYDEQESGTAEAIDNTTAAEAETDAVQTSDDTESTAENSTAAVSANESNTANANDRSPSSNTTTVIVIVVCAVVVLAVAVIIIVKGKKK